MSCFEFSCNKNIAIDFKRNWPVVHNLLIIARNILTVVNVFPQQATTGSSWDNVVSNLSHQVYLMSNYPLDVFFCISKLIRTFGRVKPFRT